MVTAVEGDASSATLLNISIKDWAVIVLQI